MDQDTTNKIRMKWLKPVVVLGVIFFIGITAMVVYGSIPPADFPNGTIITIPKNSGLSKTADNLAAQGVIKSPFLYKAYVVILRYGTGIQAGDYLFDAPQSALRVAYRTAYGIGELPKIKVTIPEGSDLAGMTAILAKDIPNFATTTFLSMARSDEGYLFPDTYFFYENTTPQEAVDAMRADFDARIATANSPISAFIASTKEPSGSRYSLNDIIKMASIVEKEATSSIDRRIIAGILWKRLSAGMPLQTDLAPDTYIHTGLPSQPVDDPGLDAILDTVTPTLTSYWFYISGKDGAMHYAATLEGHNANIAKYLK